MKYIQVQNWYITDCIDYKYWDYIKIETDKEINISWFMTYKDWVIWVDEVKKAEIEEAQRLAQEEQDKQQAENEKNSFINTILEQVKNIEERAIRKKSEYLAAESIKDEEIRKEKIKKIIIEWQAITQEYEALVKLLREDFNLDLSQIV